MLGFPDGDDQFAGGFKGFDVGEGSFTQERDCSSIVTTGVFLQGGIESFKAGTPSGRKSVSTGIFALVLFFHFYPKPSSLVLKENGTIPF